MGTRPGCSPTSIELRAIRRGPPSDFGVYGTYKFNKKFPLRDFGLEFKEISGFRASPSPASASCLCMMVYKHAVMESHVKIDLPRLLKSLKQLSDFDFFTAKFTFKFVEVRTPKSTAIALLDAIRYKAGLSDMVDFSMPTNDDDDNDASNNSKRPRKSSPSS